MVSITVAYCLAIGSAFVISSIYFYYTYRNTICYYDDDVIKINNSVV